MDYMTFLARVIKDGTEAAEKDYEKAPAKRKGAVEGFQACEGKTPPELAEVLDAARKATAKAHMARAENYWEIRCYELEVEWTCNVVSAALTNQGIGPIVSVTARGMMKAAGILGVSGQSVTAP